MKGGETLKGNGWKSLIEEFESEAFGISVFAESNSMDIEQSMITPHFWLCQSMLILRRGEYYSRARKLFSE